MINELICKQHKSDLAAGKMADVCPYCRINELKDRVVKVEEHGKAVEVSEEAKRNQNKES